LPQFTLRRLFLVVTLFACFSWLAVHYLISLAAAFFAVCLLAVVVGAILFANGMLLLITAGEKAEERIERLLDRRAAGQETSTPSRRSP